MKNSSFLDVSFKVLLLYRKNEDSLDNSYKYLTKVKLHETLDTILGDFNISSLDAICRDV